MKYSNLSGDLVQSFIINSISVKYIAPDKKKTSGVIWCYLVQKRHSAPDRKFKNRFIWCKFEKL